MKKKIDIGARIVLGLILLAFGLNKFLQFMPMPEMPEAAGALMGAFMEAGYIMPMIAIVEVVIGIMLLAGLFVPLALLLLVPLSVNIILFHVFLDPAGMAAGLIVFVLNVYLLFTYLDRYKPILRAR